MIMGYTDFMLTFQSSSLVLRLLSTNIHYSNYCHIWKFDRLLQKQVLTVLMCSVNGEYIY